jgi:hypothetical protein
MQFRWASSLPLIPRRFGAAISAEGIEMGTDELALFVGIELCFYPRGAESSGRRVTASRATRYRRAPVRTGVLP